MDEIYAFHRHIYDFTREFYLFGRDRLIRSLAPPPGGTVLEVGLRHRAQSDRGGEVMAQCALSRLRHQRGDARDRAQVGREAGAGRTRSRSRRATPAISTRSALFGLEKVDRMFMSYTLSMIPPWQEAIERGAACLAPGGSLHIVDFGQYERLPGFLKRLHFKSLNDFHVFPRREMPAVLKRVAEEQGLSLEFTPLYRGYAWSAVLSRA